jgi:hypothetical protein
LSIFSLFTKDIFIDLNPGLGNNYASAQKQQLPYDRPKAPSGQYSIVRKKCHPLFSKIQNPAPQIFKKIVQNYTLPMSNLTRNSKRPYYGHVILIRRRARSFNKRKDVLFRIW